jgi:predicted enzyme related to lactoylglutathione lyase
MARVTGIGGVFFRSKDPKATVAWYAEHLGITMSPYFNGTSFEWSDEVPKGTGATAWSVFGTDSGKFGELTQQSMVNYRVDDMDALLESLAAAGVWIDPKRDDSEYGKFAWIKDCDGNRVELWQPLAE